MVTGPVQYRPGGEIFRWAARALTANEGEGRGGSLYRPAAAGGEVSGPMRRASPYTYAVLERLLQENFPFPRRLLQLHALLLTSGALLPCPERSAAVGAFPYNCLAHAHLRLSATASPSSPPSAPLRLFTAMLARGARPNRHSFPSLLKSASASGSAAALHAQCLRRGLAADRYVACSLISAYGRTGCQPARDACRVFDDMVGSPDLAVCNALLDALCLAGDLEAAGAFFERMVLKDAVSWTTLLSGLSRGGRHHCALEVFRGFLLDNTGRRLGEATLVSVLSACANLDGAEGLAAGMAVHAYIVRHELDVTSFLGTALVDMYGKHGRLGFCRNAFDVVPEKEVCAWNALLSALANHGMETEALVKFDTMRTQGFLPNQITFLTLLTACARAGLFSFSLSLFLGPRAARPSRLSSFSLSLADEWAHLVRPDSLLSHGRARLDLRFPSRKASPCFPRPKSAASVVALAAIAANPSFQPPLSRLEFVSESLFPLSRALSCSCDLTVVPEPPLAVASFRLCAILVENPQNRLPLAPASSQAKNRLKPSFLGPDFPTPARFPAKRRRASSPALPQFASFVSSHPSRLESNRAAPVSQNGPFEGDQDQVYEEEPPQYFEQGKWISPSAYSFEPIHIA
nr:unnamed protein product [Digitaria exilis]